MTILIIGGTGFIAPHLASLLQSTTPPTPVLLTSRSSPSPTQQQSSPTSANNGPSLPFVRFDFHEPLTYAHPFTHPLAQTSPITAIYLTPPAGADASRALIAFIDFAFTTHAVRRFVLTAGNGASKGGRHVGEAWAHLDTLREREGVRYCVLRCTWFAENFAWREHRRGIREEGRVYSCCGERGVPFLAARDIAECAMVVLLADEEGDGGGWRWEESYELKGPDVMGHGEAADILGKVLGRKITHVSVSPEELGRRFVDIEGIPEKQAKLLVWLYEQTAAGDEAKMNDHIERVTGRKPLSLERWATLNKEAFA